MFMCLNACVSDCDVYDDGKFRSFLLAVAFSLDATAAAAIYSMHAADTAFRLKTAQTQAMAVTKNGSKNRWLGVEKGECCWRENMLNLYNMKSMDVPAVCSLQFAVCTS